MYKRGEINQMDVVRRYATILDWDTGDLLPKSTMQFRESYEKRTLSCWG